ncbi:MAG: DUF485 domain-containing protein [Candidatus Binatia bacterium]
MTDPINPDRDLSPIVGIATDVARLGHSGPVPAHEQTADEDIDVVDWERVAAMPEFTALMKAKAAFVVPATVFFLVYYFALLVLVGWFPDLMRRRVGPVNLAYLFALSQFFMAWTVAFVYLRKAAQFDAQAKDVLARLARLSEMDAAPLQAETNAAPPRGAR